MWFYILLAILAVMVVYGVFPPVRSFLDGWKTRITASAGVFLSLIEAADTNILTQALNLDDRGKAILIAALFGAAALFRELAKSPGSLAKPK